MADYRRPVTADPRPNRSLDCIALCLSRLTVLRRHSGAG
jgi:hypothetical protein